MANTLTPSPSKYPYKTPFLSKPDDNDLSKQWVVEYGVWSEREGKLKRKRVVLPGDTVSTRLSDARDVIAELKKMLKGGVCVDPLQAEPVKAEDPDKVVPSTLLKHAINVYLDYKQKTTKHNSWRTYRSSLRVLSRYLAETPGLKSTRLNTFHHGDALAFLDKCILKYELSNRGRNNAKDNAAMMYGHWCNRINKAAGKVILVNPFDDIIDLATKSGKHAAYTDSQRIDFKECCLQQGEEQLLLFVQIMYYTFMRPRQEVRLLKVRDLRENTIFIDKDNSKNSDDGYVEIAPPLAALIEKYKLRDFAPHCYVFGKDGMPGPDPVGPDYFYQHHRRILEKMGVPANAGYDMYSWKHTGVISLWNAQ